MKVAKKHICMVVTRICTILVMLGCVQTINAGTTEMTYDAAGNLLTKLTAELKKSISAKGCITYTYDHERVKEVLYPKNLFNRVTYTYGAPGDKYNRAGRIALIEDASGGEAYYYGRMGEVTKTVRTVMASTADIRTYVHGATYDSWNRVRTMTYPDGEVVTYHYDEAGQVSSLTSNKSGVESVIVDMMGYDEFGHMVYQKLGNGAETTYAYDKQRQRLQEMNLSAAGSQLMQNRYEYDKVDNILSLVNNVSPQNLTERNSAKLGGTSRHTYQYDELNRLISAQGKAKSASYDMSMTFNNMSMPISKVQTVDSTTTATSYNNIYRYEDSNHPTAPTQIGNDRYEYDANGNPTLVTNDSLNTTRELYWDEENRLAVLSDNGKTSRYTYNHAGERIVKSHGDLEGVYINGAPQGITFHEHDEFTLYPASIISVNKNRFTKHYFIGDKRIASRIGSGQFNNVYGRNGCYVTAGQQDYAERMSQIESQKEEYYKELGIPPGVPTMKGAYGDPENTGVGYNTIITELGDHSVPKNWEQYIIKKGKGETPGPPIIWGEPQSPEEVEPGYGYVSDDTAEEETFFYHSDHLGSTSYITDQDGNITQYTAYLPYGELLVDEHSSSEDLPYKFNGKELDEETGLYYYGARYMNPVASIWYGVDPLTEKYPSLSAYVYCAGNPVKLIDPNGMAWEPTKNKQTNEVTGYKWIQPKDSYDRNGNLLPGLYEQAIFFSNAGSDGKKYDSNSKYNIGTSTAYVYKSDGTVALFNACTNPSDINKYPSVPAGSYEAMVGKHKGQYSALRMSDVGTQNFYNNSIELGEPNLAHPNKTTANGINIHKPGLNNLTGMTSKGTAVSEGCFLIDRNQWGTFMECFQPNVRIGIAVSRTMAVPTNKNTDNSLFKSNKLLYQPITMPLDALRVVKPLMR